MNVARRHHETDKCREDHQRHYPRFQQGDVIGDTGLRNAGRKIDGVVVDNRQNESRFLALRRNRRAAHWHHCTRGSTSNWWNGGGDGSVHSSVVAPAPHGLSAACCLRTNASTRPQMKISTPKPEI